MSRKGNCWDNACVESFFGTLKRELVYHRRYATREEAKQDIFEYIEVFYNRTASTLDARLSLPSRVRSEGGSRVTRCPRNWGKVNRHALVPYLTGLPLNPPCSLALSLYQYQNLRSVKAGARTIENVLSLCGNANQVNDF